MSAYLGAGIAQGAQQAGQYVREKPERDLRMQEAKNRQQLSSMKLQEYAAGAPMRQTEDDVKIQQLENELYKGRASGLQAQTFAALDRYQGDRNTRHLNNFFTEAKKNPIGADLYKDIVRMDTVYSEEGARLLKQAGIDMSDETINNYTLATKSDGTQVLTDMNKFYAMTGYTKHMDDQALERMGKEALNDQRLRSGTSGKRMTDINRLADLIKGENPDMSDQQSWEEASNILNKRSGGSELERMTDEVMAANPGMSKVDAYAEAVAMKKRGGTRAERLGMDRAAGTSTPEAEAIRAEDIRSSDQVKMDEINVAKDQLDEAFEGDFLSADMTDPKNRALAGRKIARLEQEFPMNVADRKVAKEIRQLTALGDVAGDQITDQQAGPIDSMIRGVKKYISNDVTGTEGTAAYEAFRNTLRHALYGATVSKGETGTFTAAMGSLKEQKGPVLVKLRTQMEDLKEQLSSVYDMNDPYVAKYRLNMDQDKLADVISALDERIDMIDGSMPAHTPDVITPDEPVSDTASKYKAWKETK